MCDTMADAGREYQTFPIIYDGDVGGRDGDPKTVYRVQIDNKWTWFIGAEQNDESNEDDFRIVISSFGVTDKLAILPTTDEIFRIRFPRAAEDLIKRRLVDFFLGSEEKPFFPFIYPKARCLDVRFSPNWILTT